MPYLRFTKVIISHFISKDKTIFMRNGINLHTIRDDTLLGTLKFVSKIQDCQQYRALIPDDMINQDVKDSKAYKTYYDFATRKATPKKARKFKKVASPIRKLSPVLEEDPVEKPKRAKKPTKKYATVATAGVAIRDTLSESVPKKKTPAKVDRGKGMDLLSDVALLGASQLKKTLKKIKLETYKLHASGSYEGVGSLPKVPDEQEDKTTCTNEGTDSGDDDDNDDNSDEVTKDDDEDDIESDADDDKEASNSEKTTSDEDKNLNLNQNDDEEEEHEEEYARTPDSFEFNDDDEEYEELYKDVNVRHVTLIRTLNVAEITFLQQFSTNYSFNKQSTPTPTPATTTTSVPALPYFSSLFRLDQRVFALEKELSQLKQADYSAQLLKMIKSYTTEFEKKAKDERKRYIDLVKKSIKEIIKDEVKSQLPHILAKELDKDLFNSYGKVYSLKRDREDKDKDEDPPAGSDQGLKKQKTSKDVEPSRGFKSQESKSSSSKGTKSQPKSFGKSAQAEEPVFEAADTEMQLNQGDDRGNTDDQPNVEETLKNDCKIAKAGKPPLTFDKLMSTPIDFSAYCYKTVNDKLDWTNPKGHEYPFDLSNPLPLIEDQGHQVVPANYFINNNLEYLKGGSLSKKYTTSTTKIKAAKYDTIEGIEDMVPTLWNLVKLAYNKYAMWGITHWGSKGHVKVMCSPQKESLQYDKRRKCEETGIVPTEMRATMEQTTTDAPVMSTASTAVKPCQGDSLEFYLITGSIYTDQRITMAIATVFDEVTKPLRPYMLIITNPFMQSGYVTVNPSGLQVEYAAVNVDTSSSGCQNSNRQQFVKHLAIGFEWQGLVSKLLYRTIIYKWQRLISMSSGLVQPFPTVCSSLRQRFDIFFKVAVCDAARAVLIPETFHEQTDDELTEAEINCETAQEIWLRVQQIMKGSDIGIQEKKSKLFNEWERNQVVQNAVQNLGVQNVGNQNRVIVVPGKANQNGNGNVLAARVKGNANGNNVNQIRCYNCRGLGHLARNYTQASTSGTQSDKAPVYDSDGSAEVQLHNNCYNDEIFNMFTQEEQYTELLKPIPEPHQVPQNDSNVISEVSSMEQGGGTLE
ncbi:hypothetical protein Tco_0546452 [Tanacetum coccineum]